jgi:integrase
MASILPINGKWRALVRRKGYGAKCRTFGTKAAAETWARGIERDMDKGVVAPGAASDATVDDVIRAYRAMREATRPISDSSNEHYMLKALGRGLGSKIAALLTPDDLVAFAVMRREEGAGPYTINMDVSKLGTVLRYGGAALKTAFPDVTGAARPTLWYLRLIGGGGKRERLPTEDEFSAIISWLRDNKGPEFADCVLFMAITAMRRGEVCNALRKAHVNKATHTTKAWRKHPRKGKVEETVPLIRGSWEILERQPGWTDKTDDRLFGFSPQTMSKYFHEACVALSIPDLHLHDMRHEGATSMFEEGYRIEEVALVTGHKDWRNLKRYTNLRPESLTKKEATRAREGAKP